jgi:hypothetical protein
MRFVVRRPCGLRHAKSLPLGMAATRAPCRSRFGRRSIPQAGQNSQNGGHPWTQLCVWLRAAPGRGLLRCLRSLPTEPASRVSKPSSPLRVALRNRFRLAPSRLQTEPLADGRGAFELRSSRPWLSPGTGCGLRRDRSRLAPPLLLPVAACAFAPAAAVAWQLAVTFATGIAPGSPALAPMAPCSAALR